MVVRLPCGITPSRCPQIKAHHLNVNAAAIAKVRRFLALPMPNEWVSKRVLAVDNVWVPTLLHLPAWVRSVDAAVDESSSAPLFRLHLGRAAWKDYVLDVVAGRPVSMELLGMEDGGGGGWTIGVPRFWPPSLDDPQLSLFMCPAIDAFYRSDDGIDHDVRCKVIRRCDDQYEVSVPSLLHAESRLWVKVTECLKSRAGVVE